MYYLFFRNRDVRSLTGSGGTMKGEYSIDAALP